MDTTDVTRKLYPRLMSRRSYETAIAKTVAMPHGEAEIMALARPLAGDLFMTYALETSTGPETLTWTRMKQLGMERDNVIAQSTYNQSLLTDSVEVTRAGPVYQVIIPHDLSPTIYIHVDFWAGIRRQLEARPLAAFAHRNFVAFTAESDEEGRAFLRHALANVPDDEHRLSRYLYTWDEEWASEIEPGSDQLSTTEVPLDRLFHQLEPAGRVPFPTVFPCPHCGAETHLNREGMNGNIQHLLPHEYEPFTRSWRAFPTSAPGRFRLALRCMSCRAPVAIGGEDLRPSRKPKDFRPVVAWTMDPPSRKPW